MKKLVDVVSENNSLSFFSNKGPIPEEKVLPLIKRKILDLYLVTENEGVLVCVPDSNSAEYKKSLEVFSAPYSSVLFDFGGSRVSNNGVWELIKADCSIYAKKFLKFTLNYFPLKEYKDLEKHGRII